MAATRGASGSGGGPAGLAAGAVAALALHAALALLAAFAVALLAVHGVFGLLNFIERAVEHGHFGGLLLHFAKLFGEYLRVENVLQNYDEFASLKALQNININDPEAVEEFKTLHYLSDEDLATLQTIKMPSERKIQDYRSTYNDVRDWLRREKSSAEKEKSTIERCKNVAM